MSAEYTKELIELNWKILNYSNSQEEKQNADRYLIDFKVKTTKLKINKTNKNINTN